MKSDLFLFIRRRISHTEWVLFFTFWLTIAYFFPRNGSWNDNARLDTIYCLIEYKTFIIEKYKDIPRFDTGDVSAINGRYYSNKSPAMSLFGLPSYWVFTKIYPILGIDGAEYTNRRWWMVNTVVSVAGGLCAALIYRVFISFGIAHLLAVALATFFSMGTIHLGFSVLYYPYTLVSFFLLFGYLMMRGVDYKRTSANSGFIGWLIVGWFIGNAVFTEFPVGLIAVGFSVYALYLMSLGHRLKDFMSIKCRFYLRVILFGFGWFLAFVPYIIYCMIAFGKLLNIYDYQAVGFFDEGYKSGIFGFLGLRPTVIYYLLIHPYRGLFFHSPVLALSIPGWIMMLKRRENLPLCFLSLYICISFILFFAGNFAWWGGAGYGPRYLAPIVPWLFIPIAFLVRKSKGPARRAMWALGVVSVMLHFMATAVEPNIPESIDYEKAKNPKFVHNYPSTTLTWVYFAYKDGTLQQNLGNLIGLQRQYSIYPLYIMLALMFALHYRKNDPVDLQDPIKRFLDDSK